MATTPSTTRFAISKQAAMRMNLGLTNPFDIKKLLKGLVCHTSEALKALDYCFGCLVIG